MPPHAHCFAADFPCLVPRPCIRFTLLGLAGSSGIVGVKLQDAMARVVQWQCTRVATARDVTAAVLQHAPHRPFTHPFAFPLCRIHSRSVFF